MLKEFLYRKKIAVLCALIAIAVSVALSYTQKSNKREHYNADIVIKNVTILTLNKKSEIIDKGWIAIKDGIIVGLGDNNNDYTAEEVIDTKGKVAMPGLVNTHSHVAMTLLRGIDDNSKLSDWLKNMNYYESKLTKDDVYWGALLGQIEMIKSGTTTFNDMYFYEESVVSSAKKTGMRAITDIPFYFDKKDKLEIDQKFIDSSKNFPTINSSFAPNPLINFSSDELQKIGTEAVKNNFIVHVHIEEDKNEKSEFIEKYKLTPLEMLSNSGLLNHKIVLAHCTNFTDSELKFLSEHPDIGISLNPKSNFKLSGSTAPLEKMLAYDLTVGLGTDGAASSNSLDMFDQMNFTAFIMRECADNKGSCGSKGSNISPEKIVRMATTEGAKVLGLDKNIGSLEIGKKADVILVDFEKENLVPSYDIYSSLVYSTDGSDVSNSIINGKFVMRNRKLVNLNEDEIIEKANEIARRISSLSE